jgi:hypothetical protein
MILRSLNIICLDLVNDTYACENDKVLNDIVKREYGFRGCEHYKLFYEQQSAT